MKCDAIFFSPTGSVQSWVTALADRMGVEITEYNLTRSSQRNKQIDITGDMVIIGMPVYAGHIPDLVYSSLRRIVGHKKPCIILTVYGNIEYGNSLDELAVICAEVNLQIIGAAALVAEHSFSADKILVAVGHPNQNDFNDMNGFAETMLSKVNSNLFMPVEFPKQSKAWFSYLIPKNGAKLLMKKPQVDQLLCTRCGICVTVCPTDAIDSQTLDIASKQCIRCFACVKNCTFQARNITPRFPFVAGILNRQGGILKKNQFCGVKTKV